MSRRTDWTVFAALVREEWRLHARLFGGRRFLGFPVLIAAFVAGAAAALAATGTETERVVAGLHAFALAFGLYSGTAGFAGSDMLENVFGELTLVLSSAATLPLSRRWLLGAFLLKDAAYYGVLFVLPMAVGIVPLVGLSATTPVVVGTLWASLVLSFVAGMAVTVAGIALRTRGVPAWAIGAALGGVVSLAWLAGYGGTLWRIFVSDDGGITSALALAVGTVAVGALSLRVYDPTYSEPTRTASDRFGRLEDALPVGADGLVAKTLLDLARSSGGVLKPFVSAAILLALVAFLVGVVDAITGVAPAPGIFFGGVLGLCAFTTYNWLTQFDSLEAYRIHPVTLEAVFDAKRTAFVLVGAPTMALPYLVAVVWFDATALDAAVGAVVLAGYSLYYYGLTVFIAGFSPNEFLFDTLRFGAFTVGVAVPLVPTLVAGFVVVPPTLPVAGALAVAGLAVGAVGVVLSSRAGPRWGRRYRRE
ncbi:hypothetical protein [Natrialbaceae archaeon AArc-T1-2]|uniref:hypothetical protein n=1 Tax=Natrialbaceae archaeon AArc-T1-2 TaxID=3053904 RepID=UPI00255A7597|nr:hypothetical protein [Natrialbaceae archaeon AArc-T1-2]WIV67575.1 hypothetical protein QQ977_02260 [Natrialbaceae archaeon AArc-T1-2]